MIFKKENSIYYRRPLFLCLTVALASFAFCLLLSGKEKFYCALVLGALSLFSLLLLLLPILKKATVLFISFTLLCAAIPLCVSYFQIDLPAEALADEETKEVTVRAKEMLSENSYGNAYRVQIIDIEGASVSGDALMFIDSANRPKVNEKIKVKAKISNLKDEDFGTYYMADGLLVKINVEEFLSFEDGDGEYLTKEQPPIARMFSNLYSESLGGEEGALMSALFLGDMSSLHASTSLSFRRLGISHLIAVSGMHISILIYGIERLLRRLTVHKHIRSVLCVLLLGVYLSIIGFPTSAVRAALMYLLVILSYYFNGRYDSMTALAFVAVFMCLLSPFTVYDGAFWLSVMATAGVLAVVSKNEPKNPNALRIPEVPIKNLKTFFLRVLKPLCLSVKTSFVITFGAICATFPISSLLFGEISVFAAPATLLLSPITDILLYGALFLPILRFIPLVPWLLKKIAGLALFLIDYFSSFDFALLSLKNPILTYSLLGFVLVLVFIKIFPLENKLFSRLLKGTMVLAFIAVVTVTVILPSHENNITYERSESKESILLKEDGKHSLFLFDTIDSHATVKQLQTKGCTYIRYLCLTGYVETVYIKVDQVVSTIKTEEVLLPAPTDNRERIIASRLQSTLDSHGVRLSFYEKNVPLALENGIVWTDFDHRNSRQAFLLNANGTHIVFSVPESLDNPLAVETRALYRDADVLIFGRRFVGDGEFIRTETILPDLEILINANAYGGISIPKSEEHHFVYHSSPTSVRYRLP